MTSKQTKTTETLGALIANLLTAFFGAYFLMRLMSSLSEELDIDADVGFHTSLLVFFTLWSVVALARGVRVD